jgi:hypothetical protein
VLKEFFGPGSPAFRPNRDLSTGASGSAPALVLISLGRNDRANLALAFRRGRRVINTRNAIADGANSAATCASAQGNHLGRRQSCTPTNGARADSLAYERRIRTPRPQRRQARAAWSRTRAKINFTHTHPRHWLHQSCSYKCVSSVGHSMTDSGARWCAERFLGLLRGCALNLPAALMRLRGLHRGRSANCATPSRLFCIRLRV